jgi:hypothetical protein
LENGVERISFETYCKIKEELKKWEKSNWKLWQLLQV